MFCELLVTREPPREKEHGSQFRDLRRLETERPESDPAARTVNPNPDMRDITKGERNRGHAQPDPPGALPKMVIDQRGGDADGQTNTEPDGLAFQEKQCVAVAIAGKSARAEKHHDADDQKSQHR